jgi:hypothetical protein
MLEQEGMSNQKADAPAAPKQDVIDAKAEEDQDSPLLIQDRAPAPLWREESRWARVSQVLLLSTFYKYFFRWPT